MFRQPSSRKYKNKGLKVRNALLIFLMLAVFLWFIYQLLQSPVGRKVLVERNTNVSEQLQNRQDRLKLGRKDLREGVKVSDRNGLNNQSEEDEEVDDSKHEENDNKTRLDNKDHIDEDRLEEKNTNVSKQLQNKQGRLKLGRKDLRDGRDVSDINALNNQAEEDEEENDNEAGMGDKEQNDEYREYEYKEDLVGEEIENEEDADKQQESEENNGNSHEAQYNRDELRLVKLDRQRGSETNLEKSDDELHDEEKRIVHYNPNDDNHFDEHITDATLDSTNSEDTTQLPSSATYKTPNENGSKNADLSGDGILVTSTVNKKKDHISNESGLAGAGRVYSTAPMEDDTSVTAPNLDRNAALNVGKTTDHESLESNIELRGSMEQPSSVTTEDNQELISSNTTTVKLKGELADDNNTPTTVDDKSKKSQTSEMTHQVNVAPTDLLLTWKGRGKRT